MAEDKVVERLFDVTLDIEDEGRLSFGKEIWLQCPVNEVMEDAALYYCLLRSN